MHYKVNFHLTDNVQLSVVLKEQVFINDTAIVKQALEIAGNSVFPEFEEVINKKTYIEEIEDNEND